MHPPDQKAFFTDIEAGPFKIGVLEGRWGWVEASGVPWPKVVLWVSATIRDNSPTRFYICLDCKNYPIEPPTGNFWDVEANGPLSHAKRPKGKNNVGKVFRTDWEQGMAFYHPYDRVAANSHKDWAKKYPHIIWDRNHTIVDLLEEIYRLLNCNDYTGV